MAIVSVLQLMRHVPSVEDVLADLHEEKKLAFHVEPCGPDAFRIGFELALGH